MLTQAVLPSLRKCKSLDCLNHQQKNNRKRPLCCDDSSANHDEPLAKWAYLEEPSPSNEEYYNLPISDFTSELSEPSSEVEYVDVDGPTENTYDEIIDIKPTQLDYVVDHVEYCPYADQIYSGEPNPANQDENQIGIGFVFPGTSINVTGVLGKGAFGLVFETYFNGSSNAVKMVRNITGNEKRNNEKEANILNSIVYFGLDGLFVKCFEFFTYGNSLCFVMEKMEMDLSAYMMENQFRPLDASIVVYMAKQLFDGLDRLMELGYCHADLKPNNILLVDTHSEEDPWKIKIADFGHSVRVEDIGRKSKMQVPIYRSPELHLSGPGNKTIDTWSVGVTLFFLYTGEKLFNGTDSHQILKQIHENTPLWFLTEEQEADLLTAEVPERAYNERGFDKVVELGLNFQEENEVDADDLEIVELMNYIMVPNPEERPTPQQAFEFLINREVNNA